MTGHRHHITRLGTDSRRDRGNRADQPAAEHGASAGPGQAVRADQTYDDDTIIQVVRVSKGQIGPYAAGGSRARDHLVKVTVKITAGGDAIDLTPDVTLQYGAGGQTAETVVDKASTRCRRPRRSSGPSGR